MSPTPPLPALAGGTIVIKPPQLPLLQLLLQLQPRSLPGPHVPPTQLLPAPAEGTIALLPPTPLLPVLVGGTIAPLHPALVEGTIALSPQLPLLLPLLPQQKGVLLKNHQGAVVLLKGNLVQRYQEVRY